MLYQMVTFPMTLTEP